MNPTWMAQSMVLVRNGAAYRLHKKHQAQQTGAGVLHLRELRVLRCVVCLERDREVVGKLACH